jgi:hypothetical protein
MGAESLFLDLGLKDFAVIHGRVLGEDLDKHIRSGFVSFQKQIVLEVKSVTSSNSSFQQSMSPFPLVQKLELKEYAIQKHIKTCNKLFDDFNKFEEILAKYSKSIELE